MPSQITRLKSIFPGYQPRPTPAAIVTETPDQRVARKLAEVQQQLDRSRGRPAPSTDERIPDGYRGGIAGQVWFLPIIDSVTKDTPEIRAAMRLMRRDGYVKAAWEPQIAAVASEDYQLQASEAGNPEAEEQAEFVKRVFSDYTQGGMPAVVRAVCAPLGSDGFSIPEKVWAVGDKGRLQGKIVFQAAKAKDPDYLRLEGDKFGNVEWVTSLRQADQRYPITDFLYARYLTVFNEPLGEAAFRPAYGPYWMRDTVRKLRVIHHEKKMAGMLVGEYDDPDQRTALEAALRAARSATWMAIPTGTRVNAVALSTASEPDYKSFDESLRDEIVTAIYFATLQTLMTSGGGDVRGDSEVQKSTSDLGPWLLMSIVTQVVNEQLIPDLIDFNFPYPAAGGYPKLSFGAVSNKELMELVGLVQAAQGIGLVPSKKYYAKALSIQEADPNDPDDQLKAGGSQQPPQPGGFGGAAAGGYGGGMFAERRRRGPSKFSEADEARAAVASAIKGFAAGEGLDGLKVYFNPDGPKVWVDQMDWHDGEAGKAVIAAAEKALGVECEEVGGGRDGADVKGAAVLVCNEGPKPPGDGWVDLTREIEGFSDTRPTAAVDLDGTLASYDGWKGSDHFGAPRPGAGDFLRELGKTHRILIFTTRTKDDDPALLRTGNAQNRYALASLVKGWMDQNRLPYDDVYIGQGKPIADVYVDDRAVPVPPNPGPTDFAAALRAIRGRGKVETFASYRGPFQGPRGGTYWLPANAQDSEENRVYSPGNPDDGTGGGTDPNRQDIAPALDKASRVLGGAMVGGLTGSALAGPLGLAVGTVAGAALGTDTGRSVLGGIRALLNRGEEPEGARAQVADIARKAVAGDPAATAAVKDDARQQAREAAAELVKQPPADPAAVRGVWRQAAGRMRAADADELGGHVEALAAARAPDKVDAAVGNMVGFLGRLTGGALRLAFGAIKAFAAGAARLLGGYGNWAGSIAIAAAVMAAPVAALVTGLIGPGTFLLIAPAAAYAVPAAKRAGQRWEKERFNRDFEQNYHAHAESDPGPPGPPPRPGLEWKRETQRWIKKATGEDFAPRARAVRKDATAEGVPLARAGAIGPDEARDALSWHDDMSVIVGKNRPNTRLPDETRPGGLSDLEYGALQKYSFYNDAPLNQLLRGQGKVRDDGRVEYRENSGQTAVTPYPVAYYREMDKALQAAFDAAPVLKQPVTVYRGMQLKPDAPLLAAVREGLATGRPIRLAGYTSTATGGLLSRVGLTDAVPKPFRGNTRLVIRAVQGIDMEPVTQTPGEKELLLDHRATYRVDRVTDKNGKTEIALTQLPPGKAGPPAERFADEPADSEELSPELLAYYEAHPEALGKWTGEVTASVVPAAEAFAEARDEVALAGPDGKRAAELLAVSKAAGVQTLHDVTDRAVRRLLMLPRPELASHLFDDEELEQIAGSLAGSIAAADLLGRARIRRRAEMAAQAATFADQPDDAFYAFDEPVPALPPEQATAYFHRLVPALGTDPGRYGPMLARHSFTLAVATEQTLLDKVKAAIAESLRTGGDATPDVQDVLDAAGVSPRNPQYSEMVVRTNVMDALNNGAMAEMQHPEMQEAFPVWRYDGILDSRTGDDHRPLIGRYYPNSAAFAEVRGPRVYNCRCSPTPVYKTEAAELMRVGKVGRG